jgi:hypothetical protein
MQDLWARLLAGEANTSGTFSKRVVNVVGGLSKNEAKLFHSLCNFGWKGGELFLLIFDHKHNLYVSNGIDYKSLTELESIGLVSTNPLGLTLTVGKQASLAYFDKRVIFNFDDDSNNKLPMGTVMLTSIGQELAHICETQPIDGFYDYVVDYWRIKNKLNVSNVSSPIT